MFVKERFALNDYTVNLLQDMEPSFGYDGFGMFVFYRTYSRIAADGHQENWADCVTRVINGCMSIRKDWYLKNGISWDEKWWQNYAKKMAISLFKMEWMPGGRGLWAMGTEFIYERGSMALNNCFGGETEFITDKGLVNFFDTEGTIVNVLCVDNILRPAEVKNFGKQQLQLIIFKSVDGERRLSFFATKDHGWILSSGTKTYNIECGNIVQLSTGELYYVHRIIETSRYEDVYCVNEPITHTFTLAGGVPTANCGYVEVNDEFEKDLGWLMDALMLGVGVGYRPFRNDRMEWARQARARYDYIIPDSREGWVESCERLINAIKYGTSLPRMIYDIIRPAGEPIKGFGGIASGPEPLMELHEHIEMFMDWYMSDAYYDSVMLKSDIANTMGVCVVAGNCRRSALLASLSIKDATFKDLKQYENSKYSYRQDWGWMSNNSVTLEDDEDFEQLSDIANRVIMRGEPGYLNLQNFKYGRIGKRDKVRLDKAQGINPCGESLLESYELCNQAETLPTICQEPKVWLKACEYATLYTSTVSLLPTHRPETNRIVARNRRITIGIIDYSGWKHEAGVSKVTKWMRTGYTKIRETNQHYNGEAGVPEAIRVTTIKPGGTTPKLAGKTPGIGHPTFEYIIRRVNVAKNSPLIPLLGEAGIPFEDSVTDKYSYIIEWPIHQGPALPADKVSLWEQAMNLVLVQREWADNAVSNTLYFRPRWVLQKAYDDLNDVKIYLGQALGNQDNYIKALVQLESDYEETLIQEPRLKITFLNNEYKIYAYDTNHEEHNIEPVLAAIAPLTKTVSLLPHTPNGVYAQMPEEGISKAEYEKRKAAIKNIDWSRLRGSDGTDEKFCSGPQCEIPVTEPNPKQLTTELIIETAMDGSDLIGIDFNRESQ